MREVAIWETQPNLECILTCKWQKDEGCRYEARTDVADADPWTHCRNNNDTHSCSKSSSTTAHTHTVAIG